VPTTDVGPTAISAVVRSDPPDSGGWEADGRQHGLVDDRGQFRVARALGHDGEHDRRRRGAHPVPQRGRRGDQVGAQVVGGRRGRLHRVCPANGVDQRRYSTVLAVAARRAMPSGEPRRQTRPAARCC
jgi:hypothetical protein